MATGLIMLGRILLTQNQMYIVKIEVLKTMLTAYGIVLTSQKGATAEAVTTSVIADELSLVSDHSFPM